MAIVSTVEKKMVVTEVVERKVEVHCEQCGSECATRNDRCWTKGTAFLQPNREPMGDDFSFVLHFCNIEHYRLWSDEHVFDDINGIHRDVKWI